MDFYTPYNAQQINPPLRQPGAIQNASTTSPWAGAQGANAASAVGSLALSAIAAHHSHKMDRVRYAMERSRAEHARATQFQARQQQAWLSARNRDKLKESLATERVAFEIESMKTSARIENEASAANISNVSSVVQDFQKASLRAELYQQREHLDRLTASRIEGLDTQRSREVIYDPAPAAPSSAAWTQFGIDSIQIGRAAFGPEQRG